MAMSCITARNETVPWLLWTWLIAALGKHTRNISKAGKKRVECSETETWRRKRKLAQPGSRLMPQTRILKNSKTKGRKRHLWTSACTGLCLSRVSGLWPSPHARASVLTQAKAEGRAKFSFWAPGSVGQTFNRSTLSPQSRFLILGIWPVTGVSKHLKLQCIFPHQLQVKQGRAIRFTEQCRESKRSDFWV